MTTNQATATKGPGAPRSRSTSPAGGRPSSRPGPRPPSPSRVRAASRRLRALLILTALCTLAVTVVAVLNSSLTDVDSVTVTGAVNADPAVVVQVSGIRPAQRLIDVDEQASAAAVEQVPWVATARVDRSWTGEVAVSIVEREAIVALPTAEGRFALVDRSGRQLDVIEARPPDFPDVEGIVVSGVPGEKIPAETAPMLRFVELMEPSLVDQVSTITMEGQVLVVDLVVGGQARFGDGTEIEEKVQALRTILERVDLRCLAVIDLSVPSAPAVTRAVAGSGGDGNKETEAAPSGC